MKKEILKIKGIHKSFSGVHVLKGVDLNLYEGEVHALMGENGAGKSTLIKILCGIYKYDTGTMELFGSKVNFNTISKAQAMGISVIHQELCIMDHLTVAQNIFIGRELMKKRFIDDKSMEIKALKLFNQMGVCIDPSTKAGDLSVGKQQLVEIAKAVSKNCKLLVLDEPTAALTEAEVEELFKIIADLKQNGVGLIYISHRMEEIKRIADRITIMRDGEYIGTVNIDEVAEEDIVKMMVGRKIINEQKKYSGIISDAPVVLEVKGLSAGRRVNNINFHLRKGEILGMAGLMGSGRTEVARALYGADTKDKGIIIVQGKEVKIEKPRQAVKAGICYLSEDRKRYGLMLDKSITDNTAISSIEYFVKAGIINDNQMRIISEQFIEKLHTKKSSMEQVVEKLSGGNQQKVIIARWLMKNADIFIFDEPTRGIDVGAKDEVYRLIEELAAQGKSIIMISSEMSEIFRLSDRIMVMCEGRKVGELDIAEATQEKIMQLATMREENYNE